MTNPYRKDDPKSIQSMFGAIAEQYDKTNAIVSFQIHRLWNRQLAKAALNKKPSILLDLCCGTGEIGYRVLNQLKTPIEIHFIDFCPEMVACAEKRSVPFQDQHQMHFQCGDAQQIPLPSSKIDAVTIAYGIRNIKDPQKCFQEVYRVLNESGSIHILELTQPQNKVMRFGHQFYLKYGLPLLGKLATSNQAAYEYLCQSIYHFAKPEQVSAMLEKAGFKHVTIKPLTGGIATLISAEKSP